MKPLDINPFDKQVLNFKWSQVFRYVATLDTFMLTRLHTNM